MLLDGPQARNIAYEAERSLACWLCWLQNSWLMQIPLHQDQFAGYRVLIQSLVRKVRLHDVFFVLTLAVNGIEFVPRGIVPPLMARGPSSFALQTSCRRRKRVSSTHRDFRRAQARKLSFAPTEAAGLDQKTSARQRGKLQTGSLV